MIKELTISGLRGFGESQTIMFSIPDGENPGSGLNIITGANNSGKTTIIEAIRAFNGNKPSFSEGKRNIQTEGIVHLIIEDEDGRQALISSINGGSSTNKTGDFQVQAYVLQSRRFFPFEFSKGTGDKQFYVNHAMNMQNQRTASLDSFEYRISQIENNKEEFDLILHEVLGHDFDWTLEQRDSGNYYIKYTDKGISHSGEGIGDGIWSIFTICAALFDASESSIIIIDEPELSVHPVLQKKIMSLLIKYAQTRQIIISTHSPYFIDWQAISNGAGLIRVVKEAGNSKCYSIQDESRKKIEGMLRDINNPHVLGIEASEVFFLQDRIILVEGQEDVVIYNKIAIQLGIHLEGQFFGWGVGGAEKMSIFLGLFKDMGYKKVVTIFDGDKKQQADRIRLIYPEYQFYILPENDIRDKKARTHSEKTGITNDNGILKQKYNEFASGLLNTINNYFEDT